MKQLLLLTPVYRKDMSLREKARLRTTLENNNHWNHAFFGPDNLDYTEILKNFPNSAVFKFPDRFFASTESYSQLLLRPDFYQRFFPYISILITQLDSIVVNRLSEQLAREYDYIGAAWARPFYIFSIRQKLFLTSNAVFRKFSEEVWIGNGGLSLRNVKSTIEVLEKFLHSQKKIPFFGLNRGLNEDVVISYLMYKYGKKLPTLDKSASLFLEASSAIVKEVNQELGFHALEKFNPELENRLLDGKL